MRYISFVNRAASVVLQAFFAVLVYRSIGSSVYGEYSYVFSLSSVISIALSGGISNYLLVNLSEGIIYGDGKSEDIFVALILPALLVLMSLGFLFFERIFIHQILLTSGLLSLLEVGCVLRRLKFGVGQYLLVKEVVPYIIAIVFVVISLLFSSTVSVQPLHCFQIGVGVSVLIVAPLVLESDPFRDL